MAFVQSALVLTALLSYVTAQSTQDGASYTVWASVVVNRIGERTPDVLNNRSPILTTTGAQQMYSAGTFFRNRYFASNGSAKISGMSSDLINADQLYILAYDDQPSVASSQAFMQGLFPPVTPDTSTSTVIDATSAYNGSYVAAPLNGYQYPQVHTANIFNPEHIYINGVADCPAFDMSARISGSNTQFQSMQNATRDIYQRLAPLLRNVIVAQALDFANAYALYDYISYQTLHNTSFAAVLPQYTSGMDTSRFLSELRYLADQEQQYELANMTAVNTILDSSSLPLNKTGSISTIAGNTLAAKILASLEVSVQTQGQYYKLSTFFTDFEPLVSLFSLMDLAHFAPDFQGLPDYASSAVFELYSWSNSTNVTYPDLDSLYVMFHFRNGSSTSAPFTSYPAFHRGPSQTDISWRDFNVVMSEIMIDDPGVWCTQCAAVNLFCAPWNSTLSALIASNSEQTLISDSHGASTSSSKAGLSLAAAGAIGAIVALAVAALIFALVMLLGGIRFHRRASRKTSELGGFKGASKMASDRDLVLPPQDENAAAEDGSRPGAHERSGSWEMKDGREKTAMPVHQERQRARDDDDEDLRVNPFANPVQARESF